MKWTITRIIWNVVQMLCFFVIPVVLIWLQYSESTTISESYKISVTGIVALLLVLVLFKKIWLNTKLHLLSDKIVNLDTSALTVSDESAIKSVKRAYKVNSIILLLVNSIMPIALLILAMMTCEALESQSIELYGALYFIGISFGAGIVAQVLEIATIKTAQEIKKK